MRARVLQLIAPCCWACFVNGLWAAVLLVATFAAITIGVSR